MSAIPPAFSEQAKVMMCFSHLRWGFVFQRPQHLLSRAARGFNVYFLEEPIFTDDDQPSRVGTYEISDSITVITPFMPNNQRLDAIEFQRKLVANIAVQHAGAEIMAWYYTPMALLFTDNLAASITVYDCMDDLSGFVGAPPEMAELERALMAKADVVFTGGRSLYKVKCGQHSNAHAFPSSVDRGHFAPARIQMAEQPSDQSSIAQPRIGYFGVIDERMDLGLVNALAELRPEWQFIMIGPVVKINPESLPRRDNLHWLGQKSYSELPAYLSGWDAGFMPFALNDATRFISPTKTPEFLAAGVPVVSTPIVDVVQTYGDTKLVGIASDPQEFAAALEAQMAADKTEWLGRVDEFLAPLSWDATWASMQNVIDQVEDDRISSGLDAASTPRAA